jgi:hypothetical protein
MSLKQATQWVKNKVGSSSQTVDPDYDTSYIRQDQIQKTTKR